MATGQVLIDHVDGESDGVAAGPPDHVRPAQRDGTVYIDGLPVGWAKVTVGSAEAGRIAVSQIVIHQDRIERDSNFFFGVSDDDETPQVSVPAPREPGFYRYTEGRDVMIFLLKDNRETHEFFRNQGIAITDNEWQWYVISDNGEYDKCEWGYIEQALVGRNGLLKIG